MPKAINIHKTKTHLSRLVELAAAGKEVIMESMTLLTNDETLTAYGGCVQLL